MDTNFDVLKYIKKIKVLYAAYCSCLAGFTLCSIYHSSIV